jgi:hypothetical protein
MAPIYQKYKENEDFDHFWAIMTSPMSRNFGYVMCTTYPKFLDIGEVIIAQNGQKSSFSVHFGLV